MCAIADGQWSAPVTPRWLDLEEAKAALRKWVVEAVDRHDEVRERASLPCTLSLPHMLAGARASSSAALRDWRHVPATCQ